MEKEIKVFEGEIVQSKAVNYDVESFITMAITQKLPVETMERFFALAREMKADKAKELYYLALSKFQRETPAVHKNKKVDYETKAGGKVRYNYAPIEVIVATVKDSLEKNGFSYTLKTSQTENSITVICEAHHLAGHTEATSLTVPTTNASKMNDIQAIGAAVTYAKRYSFCNAFGIMTADDDTDAITGDLSNVDEKQGETTAGADKTQRNGNSGSNQPIPASLVVKVLQIKENEWLKEKVDGKEVLTHNRMFIEKNCFGIEEIGVQKDRTDKAILAGSIAKFENITSKTSAKNGKMYYNATEVNALI